jgi:uncharacterized protein (TIRG00374 family)
MKRYLKILRIIILLGCLAYIVRFFYTNKDDLKLVSNLGIFPIVILCGLSAVYQVIHSYRFKIIIDKCSRDNIPFKGWFRIFAQTRFLNLVIPQFGNVYRGLALKKVFGISYTDYITAFSSFAWMDTCFNLFIASVVILFLQPGLKISSVNAGMGLLSITAAVIFLPILTLKVIEKINLPAGKVTWTQGKLKQVLQTTITNLRDARYVFAIIVIGLVTLARTILFYYILFRCFNIQPSVSILVIFYALFKISAFITITPGNLGVQELVFGFLSEQLGIGMSEGILVCAVGRIIGTTVIISLGVIFGGIGLIQRRKEIAGDSSESLEH